jgi:hypothetical protein
MTIKSKKSQSNKAPRTDRSKRVTNGKASTIREGSKLETILSLLRSKEGATLEQLTKATGWQSHSVRGMMSGTIKKKMGLSIHSEKLEGVRTYKIQQSVGG